MVTCICVLALAILVGIVALVAAANWGDDLPDLQSSEGVEASERVVMLHTCTSTAFLAVVYRAPTGIGGEPIWLDSSEPQAYQIALFRRDFELAEEVQDIEVRVFADTRYEIWVDGHWLGRGPARFSQSIREYDVYRLGDLGAGLHLVAALVQWAPNIRRSESHLPFLRASVWETTTSGKRVLIAETDRSWRCKASGAWELQSEPVHAWDLIGPTELMDLRKYESDWIEVAYGDELWSPAVARGDVLPAESPRSIPLLSYHGARVTGCGTWEVTPAFEGVAMASGSLPLTVGDLDVQWVRESCQHFVLDVAAPISSTDTVILTPISSASQAIAVTLNGTVIWQDGVSYSESAQLSHDGLAVRLPQGGDYQFVIRRHCANLYLPMLVRDGDSATIAGD